MQWWNEFVTWVQTAEGRQSVFVGALVLLAVIIGVIVAALVLRSAIARLIRQQEHERKNAVIATLIDAAVDASAWNVLSQSERILSDRAAAQAETHLRLLPVKGSGVAANWAAHELADLKHTSSTGGYQTQASVGEFRDRLVLWRDKPNRARKAFLADLERWRFSETSRPEATKTSGSTEGSADRAPEPVRPTPAAATATPVVVGAGSSTEPTIAFERPSTPTIVLPPASDGPHNDETRRLLADVDRLDVPSRERPVEELPPVEQRATSTEADSAEEPDESSAERDQSAATSRPAE
ncbi:hypothetical protein EDF54_1553 [Rathayibacter sp. PhB93]|uniref:hypothetical protein n=1 Tax=unclassified Rathayibacter TaxID=2609250 RepID=UPI000F9C95C9|nr:MULTISPECIES: hypothetical protein [unclassified Rathayibacter]ROQ06591.1 hypothetical protein EDF54_1553 [Rathayibacter sp. PhB93]TDQ14348.1 hypothetical protein EDF17_1372 [Rathayibacter sp. PhB1]